MRPLPDIDNVPAMTAWGRRSALMSAHKEAREELRDACVRCQSSEPGDPEHAAEAIAAAERLIEIAGIWKHVS